MLKENKVLRRMLCFMVSILTCIGFMQVNTQALEINDTKKVTISGRKEWIDHDDEYKLRPQSTKIKLMAHDKVVDSCIISEKDNWKYSFEVPVYDDKGQQIEYKIVEDEVKHYKTSYVQPIITVSEPQLSIENDKYTPNNKLEVSLKDDLDISEVNENTVILIKLTEKQVFVWTLYSLTEDEKNVMREEIKLRPEINQDEAYFYNGFDTFEMINKDNETMTITDKTITISNEKVWSQIFKGTLTPSTIEVSESMITNTLVSTPLVPLIPSKPEEPSIPWTPIEPSEPVKPEIPDIIVKPNEPKEDEVPVHVEKPVNTGDDSNVLLYGLVCGVTVIGILMSRKKEN